MKNAYDTVQIRELDAAIEHVLGADLTLQFVRAGQTRPQRHRFACLCAFEQNLTGVHIEKLREALVLLDGGETYPESMWLLP